MEITITTSNNCLIFSREKTLAIFDLISKDISFSSVVNIQDAKYIIEFISKTH